MVLTPVPTLWVTLVFIPLDLIFAVLGTALLLLLVMVLRLVREDF